MLNLKKTTLVFFSLISNAVLAGGMGPTCVADDVSMPCERTGWELGVQALYLKPSFSGAMNWAGVNSTPGFLYTARIENQPKWAWGFKLEGAYHFNTGNDLNLNWYHLGDETSNAISRETPFSRTLGDHLTTTTPSWDAVNLEVGQRVNFGEMNNIRIHAGAQLTHIKTNMNTSGPGEEEGTPYTYLATSKAKFTGGGPRLGADMAYGVFSGFNIYAKGAVAVLAGQSKLSQSYSNSLAASSFFDSVRITNATAITPELEAKLGINYMHPIMNGAVTLDAGYLWINYFNVLFASQNLRPVDNNFNVNGPYVGLKWLGSAV